MSEPEKPAATCATCPYYHHPNSECHRNPIKPGGFPSIWEGNWCGEHPLIQAKARRMMMEAESVMIIGDKVEYVPPYVIYDPKQLPKGYKLVKETDV